MEGRSVLSRRPVQKNVLIFYHLEASITHNPPEIFTEILILPIQFPAIRAIPHPVFPGADFHQCFMDSNFPKILTLVFSCHSPQRRDRGTLVPKPCKNPFWNAETCLQQPFSSIVTAKNKKMDLLFYQNMLRYICALCNRALPHCVMAG